MPTLSPTTAWKGRRVLANGRNRFVHFDIQSSVFVIPLQVLLHRMSGEEDTTAVGKKIGAPFSAPFLFKKFLTDWDR